MKRLIALGVGIFALYGCGMPVARAASDRDAVIAECVAAFYQKIVNKLYNLGYLKRPEA